MNGARFVRFYPSDWRSGCMGLSLEQEGFYIRLCSYVYETGQRLPADDSRAAKLMRVHTNAYKKLKRQLFELGKIAYVQDGWTVPRAEKELAKATAKAAAAAGKRASARQVAQAPGRKRGPYSLGNTPECTPEYTPQVSSGKINENNELPLELIANSLSSKKKKETPLPPKGGGEQKKLTIRAVARQAFDEWCEFAKRLNLPVPRDASFNDARARDIYARMAEHAGPSPSAESLLEIWRAGLCNIERSKFLRFDRSGQTDLTFLCQRKSFTRLIEGGYGNGAHADAPKPAPKVVSQEHEDRKREQMLRDYGLLG